MRKIINISGIAIAVALLFAAGCAGGGSTGTDDDWDWGAPPAVGQGGETESAPDESSDEGFDEISDDDLYPEEEFDAPPDVADDSEDFDWGAFFESLNDNDESTDEPAVEPEPEPEPEPEAVEEPEPEQDPEPEVEPEPEPEPEPEVEPEPEPEPEEEVGPPPVDDGPYTFKCFWEADDKDNDGYAAAGSKVYSVGRTLDNRLTCPEGYVPGTGDCDDFNPSVHPRQQEYDFNDIDDNCDGRVDEPQALYPSTPYRNFQNSFEMRFRINDQSTADVWDDVYADVEYAKLSNSANVAVKSKIPAVRYSSGDNHYVKVLLEGLSETTAYRARIQLYRKVIPEGEGLQPITYEKLGPSSTWYYTTTDGESEKSQVRTKIVLKALKQYDDALRGKVGTLGTDDVNGTRYGADHDEWWCSEFYAWNADDWLYGIGSKSSVSRLRDYFASYGAYYEEADIDMGDRGDWVSIDGHHSTMMLAIEKYGSTNKDDWHIWTVEGNTGDSGGVPVPANNVGVKKRRVSSYEMGLGHIVYSQLL